TKSHLLSTPCPPNSPLFPYTTLFRSQAAEQENSRRVVNGKTARRKYGRRQDIVKRRMKHLESLCGQGDGPSFLDVPDVFEMGPRIEARVERKKSSVVPKQNGPKPSEQN